MNARWETLLFSYTNCSHPRQLGFGLPAHAVLAKKLVLICSVYASAIDGPAFAMGPDSVSPGLTSTNEPSIALIVGVWAAKSLAPPPPTTKCLARPCAGNIG